MFNFPHTLAGCRECVHHASNTFFMDEAIGCARVKVQFGDDDQKIEANSAIKDKIMPSFFVFFFNGSGCEYSNNLSAKLT